MVKYVKESNRMSISVVDPNTEEELCEPIDHIYMNNLIETLTTSTLNALLKQEIKYDSDSKYPDKILLMIPIMLIKQK